MSESNICSMFIVHLYLIQDCIIRWNTEDECLLYIWYLFATLTTWKFLFDFVFALFLCYILYLHSNYPKIFNIQIKICIISVIIKLILCTVRSNLFPVKHCQYILWVKIEKSIVRTYVTEYVYIRLHLYVYTSIFIIEVENSVRQLSLRKIKKETWNLKLLKNSNRGTICEMHDKEHALLHTYYYKNEVWINQKYLRLVVIIEGIVTLLWL